MQTTKVYRLPFLPIGLFQRLQASQQESAKVWNTCKDLHRTCRVSHSKWLSLTDLQKHTKGKFELHSQSAQLVCRAFIGNIDSAIENRKHGLKNIKYPWRDKNFHPTYWHGQALRHQKGKTVLPMGKGRKPIVLPIEIDPDCTLVKLVWNRIAGIKASDGNERGSSSTCPECGHRHKPRSRNWKCPKCKFTGHRDVVGAVNIHHIGFGKKIVMPTRITYLRPGITRSSSSGDTRHSCPTLDLGSATCISGSSTEDRSTLSFG